jgi:F0F1-type ATP synthase membrane subunit a
MDKSNIIIIALVVAVLAFRLYTKYAKKQTNKAPGKSQNHTTESAVSDDDDYEPYSGK